MGGTGVIDRFLGVFTQYIDSGFGLVQGDVRWLAGVLIAIDITLAGLFWALAPDEDVIARLIKKTLYIGVFAYIIANYNNLAQIIYNSFAGLGIKAGGGTLSSAQLLQPGRVAQVGIDAGQPILTSISGLLGFASFFDNFIQIAILLIAWLIVVISFFVMAIQHSRRHVEHRVHGVVEGGHFADLGADQLEIRQGPMELEASLRPFGGLFERPHRPAEHSG